ncbi:MAG: hypothetical protein FWC92_01295 [Defluviitaleaceae bacterium]|nr:hypothetical protein [Defluviitaleaceae bacterium]
MVNKITKNSIVHMPNSRLDIFMLFLAMVAAMLILSGCRQQEESTDEEIYELHQQLQTQSDIISDLQNQVRHYQNREVAHVQHELAWPTINWLGVWTPERIRQNLIQNSTYLPWEEVLGTGRETLGIFYEDSIFLGIGYAIARVQYESQEPGQWWRMHPDVVLNYTVICEYNMHWEIVGFIFPWARGRGLSVVLDNWQDRRRHITDAQSVTVQIHSACYATGYLTETYHIEEIPGEMLWEETIRLKKLYSGIEILDFWYEDRRIIVDLKPNQWADFTMGTASFWLHARVVLLTFASFPDVDEIEILFGGLRADLCHHGSFYGYYKIGVGFPESSIAYASPIVNTN